MFKGSFFFSPPTMELCVKCCVCLCVCVGCALTWLVQTCSPLQGIFGVPFFGPSDHKDPFPLGGLSDPFRSTRSHTHACTRTHTHTHKSLQEAPTGGCDEWPVVIECFLVKVEERLCHMQERPEGGNTSLQIHQAGRSQLQRWNRHNSTLACF